MTATSKAGVDLLNNFKTTSKKVTYKKKSIYNKMQIHSKQTLFKILKLLPKKLLTKQSIYNKLKTHTKKNDLAMQCKSSTKKHFRYYSFTIFGFSRLLFR